MNSAKARLLRLPVENRLHALKFLRYGFGRTADPGGERDGHTQVTQNGKHHL